MLDESGATTHRVRELQRAMTGTGAAAVALRAGAVAAPPVDDVYAPTQSLALRALKRAIDLVGSILIIAIFSPALLMIAFLIRTDSHGPILFRQRRVGRNGKQFEMLKFRTMVDGADDDKHKLRHLNQAADGLFKIHGDPRITRVGNWLRTTSLDELPQLLHVVTGKMSLVGPRPLVPDEDAQISGADRSRLQMRPGMTGVWQIGGASAIPVAQMVRLDREYVENWSPWLDVKVLAATAKHVLLRRGL